MKKTNDLNLLNEGKYVSVLDGIRGFAVTYVLFYHFFPKTLSVTLNSKVWLLWDSFWMMGWSGVDLFFVLSGFLITGILYKSKDSPNYFKNFYVRRVLRIFPIYFLLILVFLIGIPLLNGQRADPDTVWYFLFLSNFDTELGLPMHPYLVVAWSLAIEEQYYLIYPTLVYYLNYRKWVNLLIFLIIVSISIRFLGHYLDFLSPRQMYHFTLAHFDGIALGGLIRLLLYKYDKYKAFFNIYLKLTPVLLLISVLLSVYVSRQVLTDYAVSGKLGHNSFNSYMYLYGYFINSLTYAGILLWAVLKRNFVYDFFNSNVLRNIGKYSFAMYLFQYIAKDISEKLFPNVNVFPFLEAFIIFFICYVLAYISWKVIEGPASRLKKKFV